MKPQGTTVGERILAFIYCFLGREGEVLRSVPIFANAEGEKQLHFSCPGDVLGNFGGNGSVVIDVHSN